MYIYFLVHKGKEDATMYNNKNNGNSRNSENVSKISLSERLNSTSEKILEKEAHLKNSPKNQKSSELQKKQSCEKKSTVMGDTSNVLKNNLPHNLLGSTISEQFQNMFHDIRVQSRMPVNVPSPPRNYPHPDWSDSTLPSISTASELPL